MLSSFPLLWARGLARIWRQPPKLQAAGSNPAAPAGVIWMNKKNEESEHEEITKLKKNLKEEDIHKILTKHTHLFRGNLYPIDNITKPLINVYFYFSKNKVYCYHSGYVWVAPEDRVYVKIMSVFTITKSGKIKVEDGKEYYFGVKK